jgi:hypothetical protein
MAAGGVMAWWVASPKPHSHPAPLSTLAEAPAPVVTQMVPKPEPARASASAEDGRTPHPPPKRHPTAHVAVQHNAPPPARSATPEQVQAKFRTVKAEYAAFKSQYGSVLEDKWNAIASEITFGKADKFDKVDAMLESLRREMAKVKSGG